MKAPAFTKQQETALASLELAIAAPSLLSRSAATSAATSTYDGTGLFLCEGGKKLIYPNKKCAVTAANLRTRGRHRVRHGRPAFLRPYYCPVCHGWHLTHQKEINDN
jgi:hypothetical protein